MEMYKELEKRMAYMGISKKKMAADLNMNYGTLLAKLGGKSHFTLDEALTIQSYFADDIAIEELFKAE